MIARDLFKKITLSLFLGIIATIFVAQHDPWIREKMSNAFVRAMNESLQCRASGVVKSVDFFKPEVVLENVQVRPLEIADNDLWSWHAARYVCRFSWWNFLMYGVIDMAVSIDGFAVRSAVADDGSLAIAPHIQNLMMGPALEVPVFLKSLVLHNASFVVDHSDLSAAFHWNSESKRIDDKFKSHFSLTDGSFSYRGRTYGTHIGGTTSLEVITGATNAHYVLHADCNMRLAGLENNLCFVSGDWDGNKGNFIIHSQDHELDVNTLTIARSDDQWRFDADARIPLSYLAHVAGRTPVNGTCSINARGVMQEKLAIEGAVAIDNLPCPLLSQTSRIESSFTGKDNLWQGNVTSNIAGLVSMAGSWKWDDLTKSGMLTLANNSPITHVTQHTHEPYWKINPQDLVVTLDAKHHTVKGNYQCSVTNTLRNTTRCITGDTNFDMQDGQLAIKGCCNDHRYEIAANVFSAPFIQIAQYHVHEQPLFVAKQSPDRRLDALIHMPFMRALMMHYCNYDLHGEGTLKISAECPGATIDITSSLLDGAIRLPQTYNFINTCDTRMSLDLAARTCTVHGISCSLHSGSITVPRAVIHFTPDWNISCAHVPLLLDRCLLNSKKDLFAITSGILTLSKRDAQPYTLRGSIILDRAQLKENIFSDAFQKSLLQVTQALPNSPSIDLVCDLSVETKDPVRIDTDFLRANALVSLAIKNSVSDPALSGSITILSGTLKFPYKPLQISRGTIQFMPDQPLNPVVDVIAKNNIKSHHVTLQVTGSLSEHFVVLESTPPLTQEQIVGLLLAGAHDESLSAVIPALLMQNVTNLVFSSHQSGLSGLLDRYVKPWMKQLNVNLVPRLSDQGGRGGLRGAIEINVNDRWRAMIEKNFSLTEDTRFELEYLLSDDVRFRVIRDERCDVGGEVEMTWKF